MTEIPEKDAPAPPSDLSESVKRALLQAGDIQDAQEKLTRIVQRASEIVPPEEEPPA